MARRLTRLIGTLVLIMYSFHLINCTVHNIEPGVSADALDCNQGLRLWSVPKEGTSMATGQGRPVVLPNKQAVATSGNLKAEFVGNTELPWYILFPLVIIVVSCEVWVMTDMVRARDLAREEETIRMYKKISLMFQVEEKLQADAEMPKEEEIIKVTKKKGIHPKMPFRKLRKQRGQAKQNGCH